MGISIYTHRPVADDLRDYLPATVELATVTIVFSVLLSIPLGIPAAVRRGGAIDFFVRMLTLIGVAMPVFWLALVLLDIFYLRLGWTPAPGRLDYALRPLPAVTRLFIVDSLIAGDPATAWDALAHLAITYLIVGLEQPGIGPVLIDQPLRLQRRLQLRRRVYRGHRARDEISNLLRFRRRIHPPVLPCQRHVAARRVNRQEVGPARIIHSLQMQHGIRLGGAIIGEFLGRGHADEIGDDANGGEILLELLQHIARGNILDNLVGAVGEL